MHILLEQGSQKVDRMFPLGVNPKYKTVLELYHRFITAISRPGGYEVYRLASNMPKSQKSRKPLQANFCFILLISNHNEIPKRGMTWTEQKLKGKLLRCSL